VTERRRPLPASVDPATFSLADIVAAHGWPPCAADAQGGRPAEQLDADAYARRLTSQERKEWRKMLDAADQADQATRDPVGAKIGRSDLRVPQPVRVRGPSDAARLVGGLNAAARDEMRRALEGADAEEPRR
jgi:hypothetical protein